MLRVLLRLLKIGIAVSGIRVIVGDGLVLLGPCLRMRIIEVLLLRKVLARLTKLIPSCSVYHARKLHCSWEEVAWGKGADITNRNAPLDEGEVLQKME